MKFLAAFQAGAKWGACTKKYVITPKDHPGVDTLLARLGSWALAPSPRPALTE